LQVSRFASLAAASQRKATADPPADVCAAIEPSRNSRFRNGPEGCILAAEAP